MKTSKSQTILALLAEGRSTTEVAAIVGCGDSYVRVVRQRAQSPDGMTPGERSWRAANPDKVRQIERESNRRYYHSHPDYRARQIAKSQEWHRARKADPERYAAFLAQRRADYRAKKAEIAKKRAERRQIVATMLEVARAQTEA